VDDRPARSGSFGGRSDRPGAQQRGPQRHAATQRGAARRSSNQQGSVRRGVDRQALDRHSADRHSADRHGAARNGTERHRTRPASSRRRHPVTPAWRPRRYGLVMTKLTIAMVSALVLGLTGYGWTTFQDLHQGLSTTDVIGRSGTPVPDKATDILLVGLDSRTDAHDNPLPKQVLAQLRAGDNEGELTDTMILVRIPNDGQHAVAISLPRDLDVVLPEGYGQHKLNSAFIRAKNATAERLTAQGVDPALVRTQSTAAGRKLLVEAVKDLTGVGIDHYAEVNLLGFALLTDAVGGVPVCLKAAVHDKFSGANFPAGPQLISGPDALAFVRQRHGLPRGDLDRIVRQQVYLASLASKILTAGTLANPSRVNQLINAAQQSLVLDEGFDVLDFATRMQGLTAGNVSFMTVPVLGDGESGTDGSVLKVDPEVVRTFVAQAVDPSFTGSRSAPARSTIMVDVFNASAVTGLAKSVSDQLAGLGFLQGTIGNSPITRTTSVVRYPTGGEAIGRMVADALGSPPTEEDPGLSASTVQVYLGKNYSGPGQPAIAGPSLPPGGAHPADATRAIPGTARNTGIAAQMSISASPTPTPPPKPPIVGGKVPCVA
jgi:LCP family protein required for cell wall assembly